jgi:hypothetical protein
MATIIGAITSNPADAGCGDVELFLAERDADTEKVARLTAEAEREEAQSRAQLRAYGIQI